MKYARLYICLLLLLNCGVNAIVSNAANAAEANVNGEISGKTNNNVQIVQKDEVQALVLSNKTLPIVLINMDFLRAGSSYENNAGIAQLTASMLGEGAGKYSANQFNEELEQYAIEFGASAGRDNFSIQIKTLAENLPKAMELLGAVLTEPHFADEDLQRIKIEQLAKIKAMNDNPAFHLQQLFHQQAFDKHAYARSPHGDEASISAIKAADLREFMQARLVQNNAKISIVGDVDETLVQNEILPYFAKLPKNNNAKTKLNEIIITQLDSAKNYKMDIPQSSINLVYAGIKRDDKLFYASYILQHIIGGSSLSSKLGESLREENGLVYGANAGFAQLDYANWFSASFATKSSQKDLVIKLAKQVIAKVAAGEITQQELQEAKDYLVGSFALETDSNGEKLQYLSMMQRFGLGRDYLQQRNGLIEAVSLAQLQEVAKRLSGEPLMILSVGH